MGHQEDGGVTIPGDVEEMTRCGTYCYGLVDMVVIDQELDLILEVLSTWMFQWFCQEGDNLWVAECLLWGMKPLDSRYIQGCLPP